MTWCESGGTGSRAILLLHGLGATAAVWNGVRRAIEERATGRWFAPDLGGHGASVWQRDYTVGGYAAEVADVVRGTQDLFVIGHSLGAYIALALASRWFGVEVAGVLGVGPKIAWSEADLQGSREIAARPVRWYATAEEAWARYRRVSGLDAAVAPSDEWLARGERDPMVSTADLRSHASEAVEIAGCGHNVQVEKPAAIVDLLQSLM